MNHRALLAAALAGAAFAAHAQSMKPGLWEITNKVQGAAGSQMAQAQAQMAEQLKNMPPDQRKMMEDMMAKQGVRMGAGGPGGTTMQVCMSREMVERNEVPMQKGDCKTTMQQRTGSTQKFAFSCSNPPSSGEGEVSYSGGEAYRSKFMINTTMNGKPETMHMEGSGKWLGADCGSLKPLAPPPQKR